MTSNDSALTPRILVVDDNLSIHEDFKKILSGNNSKDRTFDDLEASFSGKENRPLQPLHTDSTLLARGKKR